jgi:hypothetical protein
MKKNFDLDLTDKETRIHTTMLFIDITTEVLKRTFWTMTTNMGLDDEYKEIVNMKSEFIYRRMMLTGNKKNYAGLIDATEGNIHEPYLDMKGLPIKKSNVPKKLRKLFSDILKKDILTDEKINVRKIIDKYDDIKKMIRDSLLEGKPEFTLPKSCSLIEEYKNPYTQQQVRGVIIWNALEPDDTIVLPEKINLLKLKTSNKDHKLLEELKESHPDKYKIIMDIVFEENIEEDKRTDMPRHGFSVLALPKSLEKIPEYIVPLIDVEDMVDTNTKSGLVLLESLGIKLYNNSSKNQKYSTNIITL